MAEPETDETETETETEEGPWTEEQDAVFAKKAMELYAAGHEEFEIDDIAAKEATEVESESS